jgi:hypothetical protein
MKLSVKTLAAAAVLALGMPAALPSLASPAADALGQCMLKSTTPEDDLVLVRWVFVMIGKHPGLSDLSEVTADKQEKADRQMGALFERLLSKDCATETHVAMAGNDSDALPTAFGTLAQKAVGKLMDDPAVTAAAENFIKYVDMNKVVQAMIASPPKK